MDKDKKIAILTESSAIINRYIFDRSVVIAAHNEKQPFDHGTGMLLQLDEGVVVITAAHVIDKYKVEQLQIVSAEEPSNVRNAPTGKEFARDKKSGGKDVAFLLLSDDGIRKLKNKKFLRLDDLEVFPQGLSEDLAMIFGMPETMHREQGIVHIYESFSYFSNIPADFDWKEAQKHPVQVVMEYPETVEDSFTRMFADLPEPFGMSGGGIWRARFKDAVVWTPERLRLIGINTEFYRSKRTVKANRVEALLRLLAEDFGSAAEYLNRQEQLLKDAGIASRSEN